MLLHDARREARLDAAGDLVCWKSRTAAAGIRAQIAEALPLVEEALRGGPGPFAVQAAIAALHCQAARAEDTDWPQILQLVRTSAAPDAVAHGGPESRGGGGYGGGAAAALALIDALAASGDLEGYHLLHSARRRNAAPDRIVHGGGAKLSASAGAGDQR